MVAPGFFNINITIHLTDICFYDIVPARVGCGTVACGDTSNMVDNQELINGPTLTWSLQVAVTFFYAN